MLYAVLAYNNSIHSATDKKPIEIINGHLDNRDPFDINLENLCLQNYVEKHKQITSSLYAKINEKLTAKQINLIDKRNENLETPIQYKEGDPVFTKNPLAARHKTQPRYITRSASRNLGVKLTDNRGLQFHKRNIRRPLKHQHSLLQDSPSQPSTSRRNQTNKTDK